MTNAELLAEMVRRPNEDGPRLTYAAWLEQNGDPERAEFIRLQIAREASGGAWTDRERALLVDNRTRWEDELPELPEGMAWSSTYRRGFIGTVHCYDLNLIADLDPGVLDAAPITCLLLVEWKPNRRPIASRLEWIRSLELRRSSFYGGMGAADDERFVAILAEPWLQWVTTLDIGAIAVSDGAIARLADTELPALTEFRSEHSRELSLDLRQLIKARWWGQLSRFELVHHPLDIDFVRRLGLAPSPHLERLSLVHARLDGSGFRALAASLPAGLRQLDLARNRPGGDGVKALLARLPPGCRVNLQECAIGDEGLAAYAASPSFASVTELRLDPDDPIHDEGAVRLAESPHARGLSLIYLPAHGVGEAGARALLSSPNLPNVRLINLERNPVGALAGSAHPDLRVLVAGGCSLTDEGARPFLDHADLPRLNALRLGRNQLGPPSARRLARAAGFPLLEDLDLSKNPLGTEGVIELCAGPFGALRKLDLRGCGIGTDALSTLLASSLLAHVKQLSLTDNPISEPDLARFRADAALVGCSVDDFPLSSPLSSPLSTIERHNGVLDPTARGELARILQRLRFTEYRRGAWMKVCSVSALSEHAYNRRDRRRLAAYARGDRSEDTMVGVMEMFADRWLCSELPESISRPSVDEPVRVDRDRGVALLGRLVSAGDGKLRGVQPRFVGPGQKRPLTPKECETVPLRYGDLAQWFDALFGPEDTVWLAMGDGAVWASDAHLMAMCWPE